MESPLTLGKPTQEELEARRAAERIGAPFLIYRDDEGRQHIFSLAQRVHSITLGRREEADISIPWDPEMSRLHAELELRAGEWTVSDDGLSQNGTFINEMRLVGRRRLMDGDLLRVGRTSMTLPFLPRSFPERTTTSSPWRMRAGTVRAPPGRGTGSS